MQHPDTDTRQIWIRKHRNFRYHEVKSMSWVSHHVQTDSWVLWHKVLSRVAMLSNTYLDEAVHVGDKTVNADLQQHDQSSTHVLPDLRIFICCQKKQALKGSVVTLNNVKKSFLVQTWKLAPNTQLTSMKVSMLSIRAWALLMINWFTQAIAWDLEDDRRNHRIETKIKHLKGSWSLQYMWTDMLSLVWFKTKT